MVLDISSRIRLLTGNLNSMGVTIEDSKVQWNYSMAHLNFFMDSSVHYIRSIMSRNYINSSLRRFYAYKQSNVTLRDINKLKKGPKLLLYLCLAIFKSICVFIVVSTNINRCYQNRPHINPPDGPNTNNRDLFRLKSSSPRILPLFVWFYIYWRLLTLFHRLCSYTTPKI